MAALVRAEIRTVGNDTYRWTVATTAAWSAMGLADCGSFGDFRVFDAGADDGPFVPTLRLALESLSFRLDRMSSGVAATPPLFA